MPKMKNPFRIKESPYGGSKGKTLKRQLTYPEKQKLWEERSHICPKCHTKKTREMYRRHVRNCINRVQI